MFIPLALILFGLEKAGSETTDAPAGPVPGVYVERAIDGAPACDDPEANRLDLHIAPDGVPPHARSANVGEVALSIDGRSDRAVLTVGDDRWRFGGGDPHTVGVEAEGVTSAFLIGTFSLILAAGEAGDLQLVEATSGRLRRMDPDRLLVMARDGATPDGRALRPFTRCGASRLDQRRPR